MSGFFINLAGIFVKISYCLGCFYLCLVVMTMTPASAQTPSRSDAPASAAMAQVTAQTGAAGRPHPFTLSAVSQGVLSCSSRINQVMTNMGVTDSSGGAWLLPTAQQDHRLAPLVFEFPITMGGSAYVSATFAPNQANGCGATYDAVFYWPKSCEEVAKQSYVGLKMIALLKKDISMLDGGPNTKIFLMPAGAAGCISIKHEVVS